VKYLTPTTMRHLQRRQRKCLYLRRCKEVCSLSVLMFFAYHTWHHLQLEEVSVHVFCLYAHVLLTTVSTALDKDTHRQLNRIEAMLNAICNSNGILPESLPGYEHPSLALPSSHSPSSAGIQMETLHISDTCSNTSAHSSSMSKPPCKKAGKHLHLYH
jgi:hypothetical protein